MDKALAPVIARIAIRYLSGALVSLGGTWAVIGQAVGADSEVSGLLAVLIGAALGAATEASYARARKTGGPT